MHLAEGVLPLNQAAMWTAVTIPVVIWSLRGEQRKRREAESSAVVMAGVTSLLFAATLLPLPVPVVGATSHICLTPLLALIVGIRRIVWPTLFVLLLQAVFFAHGGLTTLGVNTLMLGLVGPLTAVGLWKLLGKLGAENAVTFAFVCASGELSVYAADALVLAGALSEMTSPMATFSAVLLGFAPVQVPLAILEGVISVGMIWVLCTRRPDLLPESLRKLSKTPAFVPSVTGLVIAFILSGCDYEGIDGTVFGAKAEAAGRPPTDSIFDLSQGEVGLAMSVIILFGLGFIAGRSWEQLMDGDRTVKEERDASAR